MALKVAGFVAGGTRIDTAEAGDVSYPGFFGQMAGLGAGGLIGSLLRLESSWSSVRKEMRSFIIIEWNLH
ncbi:MAG: hypothetical protein ACYDHX_14910 [Methanothrix sp.]